MLSGQVLDLYLPVVWEYGRLNVMHNLLSKRKLNRLTTGGFVDGWDDPRLLTLAGLRRRGVTPQVRLHPFCTHCQHCLAFQPQAAGAMGISHAPRRSTTSAKSWASPGAMRPSTCTSWTTMCARTSKPPRPERWRCCGRCW